jgi:hypothetical protein
MKSTVVIAAACAALLLGCLKPQPEMVQAPMVIDIPPMPKTSAPAVLPSVDSEPRLAYAPPAGWGVEERHNESVTIRNREDAGAVIGAHVDVLFSSGDLKRDAEEFHKIIVDVLERRGVTVSSYMFYGNEPDIAVVRYASETGYCGTSAFIRHSGPPQRTVMVYGEWSCEVDVDRDADMQEFMKSIKVIGE